jgi:acyl carrier protein
MSVKERVAAIIKEVMGVDTHTIDKKKKLNTITEWDSFNNLMLISKMQEEFGIEFTATEIERTLTVNDIFSLVERKLK